MAKSKAPRMKHNPIKRSYAVIEAQLSKFVIAYVTGNQTCHLINIHTMKSVTVTPTLKRLLDLDFYWVMHLSALCTKPTGDYMEYEVFRVPERLRHPQLIDYCNDRHQALIKTVNQQRLVGAAWVASPTNHHLSHDKLMQIYTLLGAWR